MTAKPPTPDVASGSPEVRKFYDEKGWHEVAPGVLLDAALFGDTETGPIQREAHDRRNRLIREAVASASASAGEGLDLIECGCGGNPSTFLADLCRTYTAVDFSRTGLGVARRKLAETGVPSRIMASDVCRLPFPDGSFDAAYSAHMIYHIPTESGQAAAFDEILRVTRSRGVAVFVLANPRPLLFPARALMRMVADAPALGALANRVRRPPPLPYKPMTLGWMRRHLARHGDVAIRGFAVASTWFNRRVKERGFPGGLLWRGIRRLERDHPALSAVGGNYVLITVRKREGARP